MMSGYLHKVGLGRTRYQNEASLTTGGWRPIRAASKSLEVVATAGQRVFGLLSATAPVTDPTNSAPAPSLAPSPSPARALRLDRVGFRYGPGLPLALDGVSFDVRPGETVALVGHSGAGKSTCANLVLRFWDVESGSVTVGGVDVRHLAQGDLRRLVGVVAQDVYLFTTTIRENLSLGCPDATDADLETRPVRPTPGSSSPPCPTASTRRQASVVSSSRGVSVSVSASPGRSSPTRPCSSSKSRCRASTPITSRPSPRPCAVSAPVGPP